MSANFSEAGEWLETQSEIALDQLPEIVRQAVNKAHAGAEVKSIEKVETNRGNKFEIKIKERNETKEILFSEVGERKYKISPPSARGICDAPMSIQYRQP